MLHHVFSDTQIQGLSNQERVTLCVPHEQYSKFWPAARERRGRGFRYNYEQTQHQTCLETRTR